MGQSKKKSVAVIFKEALICLFFLRPAVDAYRVSTNHEDAYRVSTNHEDEEAAVDPLTEMIVNKGVELATESIPGCVLQLYVWINNPHLAGSYALVSIGISALTTGYTSAMIAFDMDVDNPHRKNQPKFYGYIPDDHDLRGRCFSLITCISAVHNVSRSVGCALLASSGEKMTTLYFVGGEIAFYLIYKVVRRDFYWLPRIKVSPRAIDRSESEQLKRERTTA